MTKNSSKVEPEFESWRRFERAVDAAVKSGPKHRQIKRQSEAEKLARQMVAQPIKTNDIIDEALRRAGL